MGLRKIFDVWSHVLQDEPGFAGHQVSPDRREAAQIADDVFYGLDDVVHLFFRDIFPET